MKILINEQKRTAVEYAVCEKLVEWFGDISSITYKERPKGGYDIYFDNKHVGRFEDLFNGIADLFFDRSLDSKKLSKLKRRLYNRLKNKKPIDILVIARIIITNKVSYKTTSNYE